MSATSSIEWTDATWNPVTGCTKISPGCKHCYAERMARRLKAMGQPNYAHGFELTLHEHVLELPLRWKSPQVIFVNSMSDLFHERVPDAFIQSVFDTMRDASWHEFQLLTKRPDRMADFVAAHLREPLRYTHPNVWLGTSVETQPYVSRARLVAPLSSTVRFLSCEPLLGPLDLSGVLGEDAINWVIVGGESGHQARPMDAEWVRGIRKQCRDANVPFFFKQWGGRNKKEAGRTLDRRTWDQMPQLA